MADKNFTLLEASKYAPNGLSGALIELFARQTVITLNTPVQRISGTVLEYFKEDTLPASNFRLINEDYDADYGTVTRVQESVYPMGGSFLVDDALLKQAGGLEIIPVQMRMKLKSQALTLTKAFFDGLTISDKGFNGLNKRCSDSGAEYEMGTNGLNVLGSATNAKKLITALNTAMKEVDESTVSGQRAWMMSAEMNRVLVEALLLTGYNIQMTIDNIGGQLSSYNGVPIWTIGKDANNNFILDFDETQGSSNVASSIYLCNMSDYDGVSFIAQGSNIGNGLEAVAEYQGKEGPFHKYFMEMLIGFAVKSSSAAYRVKGILKA